MGGAAGQNVRFLNVCQLRSWAMILDDAADLIK